MLFALNMIPTAGYAVINKLKSTVKSNTVPLLNADSCVSSVYNKEHRFSPGGNGSSKFCSQCSAKLILGTLNPFIGNAVSAQQSQVRGLRPRVEFEQQCVGFRPGTQRCCLQSSGVRADISTVLCHVLVPSWPLLLIHP